MKSLWHEISRIALPLVVLGAGVAGYAAISNLRQTPPRTEPPEPVTLVETVAVEPHEFGMEIDVDGLVVPYREVTLSAEVSGRVTHKSPDCRAGRYVRQGTLLYEIDRRTYELDVKRLEREVQQAAVSLRELDVDIENTISLVELADEQLVLEQKNLKRVQDLFDGGAVTDGSLDEAKRTELTVRNNQVTLASQLELLKTRRARLEQAEQLAAARLEQAELDLERTRVTAPIDGVVVNDLVELDSYVQTGTQLVTIEDTSAVEVQCNLRMEELRWVWRQATDVERGPEDDYLLPPTPVTVTYRLGEKEYDWQGTLERYESIGLDERTRTIPCRVLVDEPREVTVDGSPGQAVGGPRALVRGMYVSVKIHAQPQQPLLRIPTRAIRPGNVVWLLEDNALSVQQVQIAQLLDEIALVEPRGVRVDDRVIVSPLSVAVDGMSVRERETP